MKQWTNQIDQTTQKFQALFGELSNEALNWKPDAKTWSIAQNLEHLIIINKTYFPLLAKLKAGTYQPPFIARFSFIVSFLGKMILDAVKPDRIKKIKTFAIWEPSKSEVAEGILKRFVQHQTMLKEEIIAAADLIKKDIVIASPANKNIVYKLSTAFDVMVTHELRHLEQAKEVLTLLKNRNISKV